MTIWRLISSPGNYDSRLAVYDGMNVKKLKSIAANDDLLYPLLAIWAVKFIKLFIENEENFDNEKNYINIKNPRKICAFPVNVVCVRSQRGGG